MLLITMEFIINVKHYGDVFLSLHLLTRFLFLFCLFIVYCCKAETGASRVSLTQAQLLIDYAQSFGELVGLELLVDLALDSRLFGVTFLDDTDQQHVVLHGLHVIWFQPLFAHGAFGREVTPDAPPAERVAARHGHGLAHQEEAERTLQQVHGGRVMSPK